MTTLDRSIFLGMLFSAPHQYMHIYGGSKNDMKTANAVHIESVKPTSWHFLYVPHYKYIYVVVCIILNKLYLDGCIRGLYHKLIMKLQWFHLTIRASPASIGCMSCCMANGSETHFMTIDDIRAQYVYLNTDIVSIVRYLFVFGQW